MQKIDYQKVTKLSKMFIQLLENLLTFKIHPVYPHNSEACILSTETSEINHSYFPFAPSGSFSPNLRKVSIATCRSLFSRPTQNRAKYFPRNLTNASTQREITVPRLTTQLCARPKAAGIICIARAPGESDPSRQCPSRSLFLLGIFPLSYSSAKGK